MTVDEVIGRNVHHLLWDKRIEQSRMVEAMGVSRATLHKKMRGETTWLGRDIDAAAKVLGVDPGRLFKVTEEYQGRRAWRLAA